MRAQAWSFWIKFDYITKTNLILDDAGKFQKIDPVGTNNNTVKVKSYYSLYSSYYAEAWNELTGPISASLRPGNTASFEKVSQRWQAVGNTVSDLTGPRFKPQTSRSRDKRVAARPTGQYTAKIEKNIQRRLLQLSNGGVMHESVYKEVRPTGSPRPRLYGLPKVHKNEVPVWPTLPMVGSSQFALAKY